MSAAGVVWVGFVAIIPEHEEVVDDFVGVFSSLEVAKKGVEQAVRNDLGDPSGCSWGYDDVRDVWLLRDDDLDEIASISECPIIEEVEAVTLQ